MPRDAPHPPPFEPVELERSLDRYLVWGLVFMVVLVAGFIAYRVREPGLRRDALRSQTTSYIAVGHTLYRASCSECHGKQAEGGSAPTLDAKEFLKSTTDAQMQFLIAGGVSGSDMPAWSLDYGGTMTDEQVRQIVTYLRSLEPHAPSVPGWREGKSGSG
ncbi:MAG: c-type cytochrome [Acidimicrobiia bacterium]|nr:c-type cytochrome [Acidimicrobiia bacterium]